MAQYIYKRCSSIGNVAVFGAGVLLLFVARPSLVEEFLEKLI